MENTTTVFSTTNQQTAEASSSEETKVFMRRKQDAIAEAVTEAGRKGEKITQALFALKPSVTEWQEVSKSANKHLYIALDGVVEQHDYFEKVTFDDDEAKKIIRKHLSNKVPKVSSEEALREGTRPLMLMVAFGKEANHIKRYEAAIKKFKKDSQGDKKLSEWLDDNGGIDGVLNYTKSKSSGANDPDIKAKKEQVVAKWAENAQAASTHITEIDMKGEYALLLVQRKAANDYIVIDHIDGLDDSNATEVNYFKGRKALKAA